MTRAPQSGQEIPVEQVSGGVLARMQHDISVGAALRPAGRQPPPLSNAGRLAHTCRLGDNGGMAGDDGGDRLLRRVFLMSRLDE